MIDHKNSLHYQFGKWLSSPSPGDEVVISGVSGRFPQCNNVSELSENLLNKRDMITENTVRWSVRHPEIPIRSGPIPNLDKFDAGFFGMHQRQVENTDLVLKKFMEVTTEAIIDAGLHPVDLENTKTGVFLGYSWSEIAHSKLVNVSEHNLFALPGYLKSIVAHRISYFFKLRGPSVVLDTACSSSLNALENAFKAIRTGQCEQALVGGAHLTLRPGTTIQFYRIGVLSLDGACKVFDQDAQGYVRGETIGCILLQKSKNSKRIYAQIVHSKVNTDGYKDVGLLYPSSMLQGQLLKEIYDECGINPNQLSYFEVHGTGTKVGDLQEIEAIDNVIAKRRDKPLWVGSVKSSIGHSEPASGFGSVAKVLVAMHTGYIPPNLHFKKAKEGMNAIFEKRLIPVTEKVPLEKNAVVGISNFGFGGNNCHVVLRRIFKDKVHYDNFIPKLICVSGRTKEAVEEILEEAIRLKGDLEWIGLIHNVFKKEFSNHLFRGFVIVRENNAPIISIQQYVKKSCPFYVKLGYFQKTYDFCAKYLIHIPLFNTKLKNFQKIFTKNVNDVNQNYVNNGNVIEAFVVQLSVIEVLKALDLSPIVFLEKGLVELLQVYPTLESTLQQIQNNSDTCINSDSIVFDLSDTNPDLVDFNTMLKIVGRLFQHGYNPQLQKMYDIIEYPVSSETPIISPLVKWNYEKSWPMDYNTGLDYTAKNVVKINLDEEDYKYIKGHVIDGRNLFPATGYLYMVWQILADTQMLEIDSVSVLFKNCKFIKATTITTNQLSFTITIQKGNGNFEIACNDNLVTTGQIVCLNNMSVHQTEWLQAEFSEKDKKHFLDSYEVYKELNLRGYNYTGLFRGLKTCNIDATQGQIEWKNNWITFIDNMLQLKILQTDTRVLYVPTEIKKMIIDPLKHQQAIESTNGDFDISVVANTRYNIIKSGGVEIHGLLARPILKKQPLEPILEKYEFIPNNALLDLTRSVTVNTQIILEESLEEDFKAIEIVDEFTKIEHFLYMPLMYNALEKIPVVRPDLTISSKTNLEEVPGIKIEFVNFTTKNDVLFIVATKMLQRPALLNQILSCLRKNGFALSREEKNFTPKNIDGVTILTEHTLHNEKLILFKKSEKPTSGYVEILSSSFEWIPQLQKSIKNSTSVIVHSTNQQPSGILGFINCLRREVKNKKIKCFFMMDDAPEFDPLNPFYKKQIDKNQSINVFKESKWGTYRHLPLEETLTDFVEHSRVFVTSRGNLSSTMWFQGHLKFEENQENNVTTYYSAINFRDVMVATARITLSVDRLTDENLEGLEYSGRDLKGNRVMGMVTGGAFTNIITSDPNLRWPVPTFWSLEDAATVPCVYSTVIYALLMRISLEPGTSILIHSATGGIGIAALNVALFHGCDVFVTVGSSEKRDYLKMNFPQIADTHIGSSRDNSFQEMIQKQTNGRGVDIVLNSLAEEKLHNSIRCLAQGGTLIEIGKFDLMNNNELNLLLLEKNASYHGVMLDHVMENTNAIKAQLREKLLIGIKAGYVKPLPRKVFDYNGVETAFRYMTGGKHIGKILIKLREEENEEIVKPTKQLIEAFPRFYCDPKKSYIIIGGLGGFGLELADWMVLRGARKLILTSRSGVQSGYQTQRIKIWRSYGAYVHVSTIDTSTKSGCLNLIKEANHVGPVDGIFNLAVILEDALFEDQNEEKFNTSFTPKALTTKFLDEITRDLCPNLSHFVVFSSVSCGRGNVGQTNYGMANSVMERICEKRKEDGFPGLAIQWGTVGDVGLVAKMQKDNKELVIGGTLQQKISSCLNVMDQFLNQTNPVVASMVVAEKRDKTIGKTPLEAVIEIIGIKNIKTVSHQITLAELGMDSIMGSEIIQILEKDFGIYVTSKEVRSLTLSKLMEMGTEVHKENENNEKISEETNLLLQHLPNCSIVDFPFVELKNSNDKNTVTVFVFPGVEGVSTSLELITKNINAKVLEVQYNFKNTGTNVGAIAEKLFPCIEKQLSGKKSFLFLGYSFGVIVALEIASLLEKKNYFGKIAALDGSPEYISQTLKQYAHDETEREFETMLLYNIVGRFAPIETLTKNKELLFNCENFAQRIDLSLSLMPPELVKQHGIKHEHVMVLCERFKSLKKYNFTGSRLKSLIKLYKAEFTMIHNVEDDYGLSQYCNKPVTVKTIEGNHETMLKQNKLVDELDNFFKIGV